MDIFDFIEYADAKTLKRIKTTKKEFVFLDIFTTNNMQYVKVIFTNDNNNKYSFKVIHKNNNLNYRMFYISELRKIK